LVFGVLAAWWNIADWRATQRIERAVESFAQVPPSLVDALPGHRATSNLRNNATIENLLDELVALADDPGVALALRVIHRSDSGDFRGAAEDAARIAAGGTAPFARLAAERYRQDKLPDDLAQGDTAPATGYAADRALAVVHAMRSRGPCPLWAATLLEQDDGLHQHLGFGELHLLLAWRRAYKLGPTDEGLAACEGLQQAVLQLETLRRRPSAIACYVQANALLQRAMFSEALSAATTGMALSPDDFTLAIAAGGAALNRNQFATAERMYRLALKLQPTSVHSHEQLCRTLLASGRLQDAEALLARIPFEESGLGEARHDILMGHLLYERAWLAARAEAAGAQPAAKPNDSDSLWRRALQSFTRARQIFGGDSSFEEVMCKGFLEDDAGCAELFQLLAQRPLDSHLIALVTEVLPATLNEQEVDALAQFLLRQIAQLGVRKR